MSAADEPRPGELAPSEVRQRIRAEHARLRRLLAEVDSLAGVVSSGSSAAIGLLRERARALYDALCAHIDLEDRILAPALRETPGFGEVREEQLLAHHADQRQTLREAVDELARRDVTPVELGRRVRTLIANVRVDIAHEDEDLLNANLLKDDPIDVSFTG